MVLLITLYLVNNKCSKKNPQPRMLMLTLKRVREMFPHMEDTMILTLEKLFRVKAA